jgi:hypothetical protein
MKDMKLFTQFNIKKNFSINCKIFQKNIMNLSMDINRSFLHLKNKKKLLKF